MGRFTALPQVPQVRAAGQRRDLAALHLGHAHPHRGLGQHRPRAHDRQLQVELRGRARQNKGNLREFPGPILYMSMSMMTF